MHVKMRLRQGASKKIKARSSITLEYPFEVELGASFEAEISND